MGDGGGDTDTAPPPLSDSPNKENPNSIFPSMAMKSVSVAASPSSNSETLKGKSVIDCLLDSLEPSSSGVNEVEDGKATDESALNSNGSPSSILPTSALWDETLEESLHSLQKETFGDRFVPNESSNTDELLSSYICDSSNGGEFSPSSSVTESLAGQVLLVVPLDQQPIDDQMENKTSASSPSGSMVVVEEYEEIEEFFDSNGSIGLLDERPYDDGHRDFCSGYHKFYKMTVPCSPDCQYFSSDNPRGRFWSSFHPMNMWDPWNRRKREDHEYGPLAVSLPSQEPVATGVGAGLSNLGNTCFLNAILQCFTHTVPLVKALQSCNHLRPCQRGDNGFCVFCALHDHIKLSIASSGNIISPSEVVDNLSSISSLFGRYQQEDAHEFLQCLLDKLERCSPNDDTSNPQDDNIVAQVFGGRLVSKLKCCNCGYFSDKYESLIDLSLEIEDVETLQRALESFTQVEKIENMGDAKFKCEKCKEEASREKQLKLDRAPSIATFHLKRFKSDGSTIEKINKHVDFPLELDLKPYTNGSEEKNVDLKYQLYAIVVHHGFAPTSGHYFSYVRSSPDTWHKLDDSMVFKVDERAVLSETAYILFYAREGTPWFSSLMGKQDYLDPIISNTSPKSVLDRKLYTDHCKDHGITSDIGRTSVDSSTTSAAEDAQMNGAWDDAEGISDGAGQNMPKICDDHPGDNSHILMNIVSVSLGAGDHHNGILKSDALEDSRTGDVSVSLGAVDRHDEVSKSKNVEHSMIDTPMNDVALGAKDCCDPILKSEELDDSRINESFCSGKFGALSPFNESKRCQVANNIGRTDGLRPSTPPRSFSSDANVGGFPDPRTHHWRSKLKTENSRRDQLENVANCKRLKRDARDQRFEAIRYINKNVSSSRGMQLIGAMIPRNDKKRRFRSSPCKHASPPNSRHKLNHRPQVLR